MSYVKTIELLDGIRDAEVELLKFKYPETYSLTEDSQLAFKNHEALKSEKDLKSKRTINSTIGLKNRTGQYLSDYYEELKEKSNLSGTKEQLSRVYAEELKQTKKEATALEADLTKKKDGAIKQINKILSDLEKETKPILEELSEISNQEYYLINSTHAGHMNWYMSVGLHPYVDKVVKITKDYRRIDIKDQVKKEVL